VGVINVYILGVLYIYRKERGNKTDSMAVKIRLKKRKKGYYHNTRLSSNISISSDIKRELFALGIMGISSEF
jgi:hypothetical protein